ncbi:MAG: 50S ribosomal protein L15 [Candidatus Magnetobacterium sp. LHC-1]|uniref:Large ribosomal subunit protein uL15 n=1 Tax=Candidatus Magnetobacterium casense TaxID=1455061 RepID=A0ABS6RVM8_9BACT|nr:50S ribosomal protein L15 [Candidatus Magnetobacterium casensis]MBF0607811.1 50S ribosomal protein L15 [Nitrospirota bacterium]MBV6340677.1 50S ribosomal protein L15 [Candidatus Magnetobacterium casensis]
MKLNELKPADGSTKKVKRVGRGCGSGHGKTSCKGHKGQKARAGSGKGPGFEGGQMPLQRRLPKRGFKNYPFSVQYAIVNLDDIDAIEGETEITPELLVKKGIVKKLLCGLKVLGDGQLQKPLTVKANKFSKTALDKITTSGGKAVVLE